MSNGTDRDLSAPGSLDELLRETEGLVEGSDELPSEENKQNAAFARHRQVIKKQQEALKYLADEVRGLKTSKQVNQPVSVSTSELEGRRKTYMESVYSRAAQRMGRPVNVGDQQDQAALSFEMTQVIIDDQLSERERRGAESQKDTVFNSIVSEFPQLDDADRQSLRKEIGALPVELQANPVVVKDRTFSWIGRNLAKYTKPSSKRKPVESETVSTEEISEEENQEELAGGKEELPAGTIPLWSKAEKKAGAAAASNLTGGSTGIRIEGEAPSEEKRAPRLKPEDIVGMKRLHLNPERAEDAKTYFQALKKKPTTPLI